MVTFHVLGLIVLVTASVNVVVNLLDARCEAVCQDSKILEGWLDWRQDVEKALVSRQIPILEGAYGHLIAGGRPNPRRGHGIVRLRRLTVIIGHGRSLFSCSNGAFIVVFDRCESILRLLTGDSTHVVDRRRRGVNPRPNTHTVVWWPDEMSPTCLSKW